MKTAIAILCIVIIAVALALWRLLSNEELPSENEIERIVVYFNEAIGDLVPDDHEPKEFEH